MHVRLRNYIDYLRFENALVKKLPAVLDQSLQAPSKSPKLLQFN